MSPRVAIADTCFLIDWARYRRRDTLFRVFRVVFVPEQVLNEIVSENTLTWVTRCLAEDKLALYTPTRDEIAEAMRLVEASRLHPQLPSIDLPEALCLIAGFRRGYVVLTENRGALLVPRILSEYSRVMVWRSLEVLVEVIKQGVLEVDCRDPERVFREYCFDTLHMFPRRALEEAVREVRRLCEMK